MFADLPNHAELQDVFLLRNSIVHNHVFYIERSESPEQQGSTMSGPPQLKFGLNQHYAHLVNTTTRRTKLLGLNASPTSVDRSDVLAVFKVIWATLSFMNSKNFAHTPLAGGQVGFRGSRMQFAKLIEVLRNNIP